MEVDEVDGDEAWILRFPVDNATAARAAASLATKNQQRLAYAQDENGSGNGSRELYYYDSAGARYMAVTFERAADTIPQRIRVWVGGMELWYSPDAGQVQLDTEHANLALGGLPVARITREEGITTTEASFHNGLGHLMGSADINTGIVNAAFVYGPYGEILDDIGSEVDTHLRRFNGKDYDTFSKLTSMRQSRIASRRAK